MMYLDHFGLHSLPFTLTPDTEFFFPLQPHQEALQVVLSALTAGEAIIKVVGEVGTGKTLICRKVMRELPEDYYCFFFPNPYLTATELRQEIGKRLKLDAQQYQDQASLTDAIERRIKMVRQRNKKMVICIDESQALPDETLEALRLFTNLETEKEKLVQVILFGQPELDARLAEDKFRQLKQRISFSYQLRTLQQSEANDYIRHRLTVSGYRGAPIFSDQAVKVIWRASHGVPRLINVLCHKSMMLCYGKGISLIEPAIAKLAAQDTEGVVSKRRYPNWVYALAVLVSLEIVILAYWWWGQSL